MTMMTIMTTKEMMTTNNRNNHYCSQKFWWLSVYPERRIISSCCSASPESINMEWLVRNPGQLFNTENLKHERQMMLDGERVESCESSCWRAEDTGLISRRLHFKSDTVTHTSVDSSPNILNIILGSDCNMTCVYCCKQYSTAWFRDINTNGSYFDDERFTINMVDLAVEKLGQNKIKNSDFYNKILAECKQYKNLDRILISGGEPFLYNGLPELVNSFTGDIGIHTGLGIDTKRFSKLLSQISSPVTLIISAETTNGFYDLVRYGNTFDRFKENLETIRHYGMQYKFLSVISVLTLFDFKNFQRMYSNHDITVQFCTDPDYLAVNVMDPVSKQGFLDTDFGPYTKEIHDSLGRDCTQLQRQKLSSYIKEFTRRREIDLSCYPESFTSWIHTQ
jgi:organic radical activating enzyme